MIFSTEDVHPRERLNYWREVATRGYVEHEFTPEHGQAFSGTVSLTSLPGLGLTAFDADAARVIRTERNAARADDSDLLLCMHQSGEFTASQDGRDLTIAAPTLFLLDPLRPFTLELRTRCRNVIVKVPRAMLDARVGNSAELTARPVDQTRGIDVLAMRFLDLLPEQAESLDDVAGLKVADQLLDLATLALTSRYGTRAALSSPRATALLRLKSTIERLLIEPGLKPERIAAESGISVRYANALLAEESTSVERYLTARRLAKCRNALDDPAQAHRSIGDIAYKWGFSDLSHFGRRFKAQYGVTPSDYRRVAQRLTAERRGADESMLSLPGPRRKREPLPPA